MAMVENIDISRISNACTCSLVSFLCCFIVTIRKKIKRLGENSEYTYKHYYVCNQVYYNDHFLLVYK